MTSSPTGHRISPPGRSLQLRLIQTALTSLLMNTHGQISRGQLWISGYMGLFFQLENPRFHPRPYVYVPMGQTVKACDHYTKLHVYVDLLLWWPSRKGVVQRRRKLIWTTFTQVVEFSTNDRVGKWFDILDENSGQKWKNECETVAMMWYENHIGIMWKSDINLSPSLWTEADFTHKNIYVFLLEWPQGRFDPRSLVKVCLFTLIHTYGQIRLNKIPRTHRESLQTPYRKTISYLNWCKGRAKNHSVAVPTISQLSRKGQTKSAVHCSLLWCVRVAALWL